MPIYMKLFRQETPNTVGEQGVNVPNTSNISYEDEERWVAAEEATLLVGSQTRS